MNPSRRTPLNDAPARPERSYVLYWMTAARRTTWSFALDRALALARAHRRPLVVFEALRSDHRWASPRTQAFVQAGMADNAAACAAHGVTYVGYEEPSPGAGRGLLDALAARAITVVTDDWPCFFLPAMQRRAAARLDVAVEAVDGNGLVPLRHADRAFTVAHAFRRHVHKHAAALVAEWPSAAPLGGYDLGPATLPDLNRWPSGPATLTGPAPVALRGGAGAARGVLRGFLDRRLARYATERNEPASEASSGLSPWLHFGHIGAHEVLRAVLDREGWAPDRIVTAHTGEREGFWGMSAEAEAFIDELVTWRELGFQWCARYPDTYDRFDSLPTWALATLRAHAVDKRPHVYGVDQLAAARTHDRLWNAAQRQLVGEGRIHNYLRMLWGKKILEWSPSPEAALDALIELNNRYAIDGRDPSSYNGIFWTLGRFDRAWGPERPIFGTVRYMSSENTAKKVDVKPYLARWG